MIWPNQLPEIDEAYMCHTFVTSRKFGANLSKIYSPTLHRCKTIVHSPEVQKKWLFCLVFSICCSWVSMKRRSASFGWLCSTNSKVNKWSSFSVCLQTVITPLFSDFDNSVWIYCCPLFHFRRLDRRMPISPYWLTSGCLFAFRLADWLVGRVFLSVWYRDVREAVLVSSQLE